MKLNQRRILMSLVGVIICAVAVGGFKHAALGVDPFQSLMAGLDRLIPISFGTLYVLVNAVLLIFSLAADRHNIGLATFINLFLLGYITEYTQGMLQQLLPEPGLGLRVILLLAGIVVICFGMSLYICADLGVSTYDALAITMSRKWYWGPFQYIRIATDIVCVVLGVGIFLLAGGTWGQVTSVAGIGTIITAFFMGPLIQWFKDKVAQPMLEH